MMKKKVAALAALALAGIMILTACSSSSEQESGQQSAAKNDTIKEGNETEEQPQTISGTQSVNGTTVSTPDGSGSTSATTGTASAEPKTSSSADKQTPQTGTGTSQTAAQETESESTDGDIWSGTYVTDDETLTIAMTEDTQISFSFAEAGISGVADMHGSQAVYKGDDHYVIVFNINGTLVDVSVSSEEDYDASDSPLIGTYVKDAE